MSIKGILTAAWLKVESHLQWTRTVVSEVDGTGSTSRLCFLLITLTVCGITIAHFCVSRKLPDEGTLIGLSSLVTAGGAGYGINKIAGRGGQP